ncbi:hypothetical protein R1flu_022032 [Riccia fluitans]|uniref:Uncharacterized protein n=1 Tax=Riccia fluitans TaxID=41844 RepID=A0ABD1ZU02_9MARC
MISAHGHFFLYSSSEGHQRELNNAGREEDGCHSSFQNSVQAHSRLVPYLVPYVCLLSHEYSGRKEVEKKQNQSEFACAESTGKMRGSELDAFDYSRLTGSGNELRPEGKEWHALGGEGASFK